MKLNACKECKRLTELDICEICKSKTTKNWIPAQGRDDNLEKYPKESRSSF